MKANDAALEYCASLIGCLFLPDSTDYTKTIDRNRDPETIIILSTSGPSSQSPDKLYLANIFDVATIFVLRICQNVKFILRL